MRRKLTDKQNKFIEKVKESGDIVASYRKSYNTEAMRESDVLREAGRIMDKVSEDNELLSEISIGLRFKIVKGLSDIAEDKYNTSPIARIRAFELLGKMTDVGLYRKETAPKLNPQSSQELEDRLMDRLTALLGTILKDDDASEPGQRADTSASAEQKP